LNFELCTAASSFWRVSDSLPTVTILIAARPEQAAIKALEGARRLDYPAGKLEILVARGRQPSAQRNAAVREARGELVYFLDDDSVPDRDNLRRAVAHFGRSQTQIVGGPNVCPPDAPPIEQVFAVVLSSWLAFGPSRARYTPVGAVRTTSEKELILCNLLARRSVLLEFGGFNEALYPNEENALMDELQKRGWELIYDPELRVWRRPRATLKAFMRMLLTYGMGRAEQFREYPTLGSALNLVPPAFCLYLLAVPFLWFWLGPWSLVPIIPYLLALVLQSAAVVSLGGFGRSLAAIPLIALTHLLYGLGFWRGLITPLRPPSNLAEVGVSVEHITRFPNAQST
jgi:succinoglycan biosynthesis protein ExoA